MLRILIADDHPVVRRGLKQVLADEVAPSTIGEASTGQDVMESVQRHDWDVLILDLKMPDVEGLDLLKTVKALRPKLPVIVLSMFPEDQYAIRVLRAGAAGYLTKESAPEELHRAIQKVVQGGKYVSASFAEQLAASFGTDPSVPSHQLLSDREFQVLSLLAQGKGASEIASQLNISVKTISTYRSRILEKLNLKTNADLIRYALDHHLLES